MCLLISVSLSFKDYGLLKLKLDRILSSGKHASTHNAIPKELEWILTKYCNQYRYGYKPFMNKADA